MPRRLPPSKRPGRDPSPRGEEDVVMLMALATVASTRGLCSGLFPDVIREFQKDTGTELPASVRQMAAMIKVAHDRGSRYTPEQVAKILRGRAAQIQRGEDMGNVDWGGP